MSTVDDDPRLLPLDDEVGVDLDGEVPVVDLQDLEVVEADGDVHREAAGSVQRRNISGKKINMSRWRLWSSG